MKDMKTFNVKIPKELWVFLKRKAADEERSMADIILKSVEKMKRKYDKEVLTSNDANV
jgi:hypothetical protein